MTEAFDPQYAEAYDALYSEKDYAGECDVLERIFSEQSRSTVRRILDLGCGTGNHSLELARRGYLVHGIDRSPGMLARAREKAAAIHSTGSVSLEEGDIRAIDIGQRFDAVLLMFAVLSYQIADEDVRATLRSAQRHLDPGGLLIFDVWYGPAVLSQGMSDRFREINKNGDRFVRFASGTLQVDRHTSSVSFDVLRIRGDRLISETKEEHEVRWFFPLELRSFLSEAGFELIELRAFPDYENSPDRTTWNVVAVAVAN